MLSYLYIQLFLLMCSFVPARYIAIDISAGGQKNHGRPKSGYACFWFIARNERGKSASWRTRLVPSDDA